MDILFVNYLDGSITNNLPSSLNLGRGHDIRLNNFWTRFLKSTQK